jgi:tRNA U55 pseudouridine synthase TruB
VLGVGAHLTELVRLRTGPFDVKDAVTPDEFEKAVNEGNWQDLLFPMDFALGNMPAAILDRKAERAAINGQPIPVFYPDYDKITTAAAQLSNAYREPGELILCRAYSLDGRFLAVISAPTPKGPWSPKRVFAQPNAG